MSTLTHTGMMSGRSAGRFRAVLPAIAVVLAGCSDTAQSPLDAVIELPIVASEAHGGHPFRVDMTQEVFTPPVGQPHFGDDDGTGTAVLRINPGLGRVCWELTVKDIQLPATAAHIHAAPAGRPGPVVVPLSAPVNGSVSGCRDGQDRELLLSIIRDPEAYYVNVHNAEFAPGAVRSQLAR